MPMASLQAIITNLPICHSTTLRSPFPKPNSSTSLAHFHIQHYPSLHTTVSPNSIKNLNLRNIISYSSSTSFGSSVKASMASASPATETTKPFSVLFVCLGNICRSPAAEAVFRDIVTKRGLASCFNIDSAGTINYHEGNPSDSRMRVASKRRGVEITSISRPVRASDFRDFDLILAMDKQNQEDLINAFNKWKIKEAFPNDAAKKVKLMCSYCKKHDETEVPDPYYGGSEGFEKVLNLLEDACESLLDSIVAENSQIFKS